MTTSPETQQDHTLAPDENRVFSDLPDEISEHPKLQGLTDILIPESLKEPVSEEELTHREFDDTRFWRTIPQFRDITREEFMDHRFQYRHSVTSVDGLNTLLEGIAAPAFLADVRCGMAQAPMAMRLSPYLLSLIDWQRPYEDPIRIQFIPVASDRRANHPKVSFDILHEQDDSPTPGLVHRYPDKALFLPLDVCPVYCRFCTRSYAIGSDTDMLEKVDYRPDEHRWNLALAYLASRPEIEDVVVSGGDTYLLPAARLLYLGEMLLAIPHIRRIRFASKGPAVMPMKILTDTDWTDALVRLVEKGRTMCKEVCLHTHFNTVNEITEITREAMNYLFRRGVKVRNQSVLIRNVNDTPEGMVNLVRQLAFMNVQPYYVYQHDMVGGVEQFRTRVADACELERHVRGTTAGFNTPTFVNDVPGGGGKRNIHSYDAYDPVTGISVYRSPSVKSDKVFLCYDPIHLLPPEGQERWRDKSQHDIMIAEALSAAGVEHLEIAAG